MFRATKENWHKAKAAVVLQNLFEHSSSLALIEFDPANLANYLITEVWEQRPDVFSGRFGRRPDKATLACIALANAIFDRLGGTSNLPGIRLAFLTLFAEIQNNRPFYELGQTDEALLSLCTQALQEIPDEIQSDPLTANLKGRGLI